MKTEKLKESYSAASLEILLIRAQDVITTSGARGEANDSRFNETPDW